MLLYGRISAGLLVNFSPMPNQKNQDFDLFILDFTQNSVVPGTIAP